MRKVSFEVPSEVIGDFTEKLTELELENSIVGKTQDNEIEVEVYYDKSESKQVDELEEYLDELKGGLGEADDEDDDDEDDEDED